MESLARQAANAMGAIVAAVDYRLAPESRFPTPLRDCVDALAYLSEHARSLGADPTKIAIMGDSAGGNLAAVTALSTSRPSRWWRGAQQEVERVRLPAGARVRAQLLLNPVIAPFCPFGSHVRLHQAPIIGQGLCTWMWNAYLSDPVREMTDPRASPLVDEHVVWGRVPSAVVVTGHFDILADEGDAYANHLASRGVEVHAARRLEAHSMNSFLTLSWAFNSTRALLHGERVHPAPEE